MSSFLITFGVFTLLLGLYFLQRYLKKAYVLYDSEETMKEQIEHQKYLIKGAMSYLRNRYDNDFESSAYNNIKVKVDFLRPIIEKRPLEKKLYYYRKLYEMLYETNVRLLQDYYNVKAVISPLQNLIDEIVEEQIEYLKENSNDSI